MVRIKICPEIVNSPKSALAVLHSKQLKPKPRTIKGTRNATTNKMQTPMKDTSAGLQKTTAILPKYSPVPVTYDPSLKHFHEQYQVETQIGSGGYGKVYSATRKSDNQKVAIKQMLLCNIKDWTKDPDAKKKIPTEVALLHKCQAADGVIRLFEYIESITHAFIVMERDTDFVDLFDFITEKQKLSRPVVRHVVRQVTQTLAKCHSLGVIHRDLKQENVLIHKENGNIKLLDFGLGHFIKSSNQKFKTFRGTSVYRPPEYITAKESFADSLTVWSIGCFAYSLFFGDVPFKVDTEIVAGIAANEAEINFLCPDSRDFILQCLQPNPESRPLLRDLVNHPWISSASVPKVQSRKRSRRSRCSYEVVEIGERPSTSSSNCSGENEESGDPRIYLKLRKTTTTQEPSRHDKR